MFRAGEAKNIEIKAMCDSKKRVYAQVLFGVESTVCATDSEVCYKEQLSSGGKLNISTPAKNLNLNHFKYEDAQTKTVNSIF